MYGWPETGRDQSAAPMPQSNNNNNNNLAERPEISFESFLNRVQVFFSFAHTTCRSISIHPLRPVFFTLPRYEINNKKKVKEVEDKCLRFFTVPCPLYRLVARPSIDSKSLQRRSHWVPHLHGDKTVSQHGEHVSLSPLGAIELNLFSDFTLIESGG